MQNVVARPAPVLSKQLAYDIVKAGAPGDADWDFVYAGEFMSRTYHAVAVHRGRQWLHQIFSDTASAAMPVVLRAVVFESPAARQHASHSPRVQA